MKTEKFNLVVDRFTDDGGNPCCAKSFLTNDVCLFYRTKNFGFHETCTLIPDKSCPIWNKTHE